MLNIDILFNDGVLNLVLTVSIKSFINVNVLDK